MLAAGCAVAAAHAGGEAALADPAAAPQTQLTFTAGADGRAKSTSPTKGYATDKWLTVARGKKPDDPISLSFVKFDVAGVAGDVAEATLRLTAKGKSSFGGRVYYVTSDWTETSLTWNVVPLLIPPVRPIGEAGTVTPGVVDIDLDTQIFAGDRSYSFALVMPAVASVKYSSREGTAPPQLILTVDPPEPVTPEDDGAEEDADAVPPPPPPKAKARCRSVRQGSSRRHTRKAGRKGAHKRKSAKARSRSAGSPKPKRRRGAARPPGRRPPNATAKPCRPRRVAHPRKKPRKAPHRARKRR